MPQMLPITRQPKQVLALDTMKRDLCDHPSDRGVTERLARLHFELRDWDEAAVLFARVAEGSQDDDRSVVAFYR